MMPLNNFSHRPGFYKTIPCRYFDFHTGRELEPRCQSGSQCGYIHPDDPQWANRKMPFNKSQQQIAKPYFPRGRTPPPPPRASSLGPADYRNKYRAPSPPPREREREREIKPDPDARRGRSVERMLHDDPRRGRSIERMIIDDPRRERFDRPPPMDVDPRDASRPAPYGGYRDHTRESRERREPSRERYPDPGPHRDRGIPTDASFSSVTRTPAKLPFEPHTPAREPVNGNVNAGPSNSLVISQPPVPALFDAIDITEKVIESFKKIAEMTNKVVLDTAAYDKEEEKLETYNNLASTLAKVSPAAVQAITPSLELVMATRKQQREKVQQNYARLTHVWEDVFALFVSGATKAIDTAADAAAARLRREADAQIDRTRAEVDAQLKRIARTAQSERDLTTHAIKKVQREESTTQKRKHDEDRRWEERPERSSYTKERESASGYREPESKRPRYSERELASFAEHPRPQTQSQPQSQQAVSGNPGEPRKTSPPSSTASTQPNIAQATANGDDIPDASRNESAIKVHV
ncbi:hypothetical protein PENSPDRAFT_399193 [Peniophora sp. CONT]|nr:hypothetical protein PENSPDRAFT_399193 [Peniophora sp. CONT]